MPKSAADSFYPNFPTLVDALRWWGDKTPDRPAITFLSDGENETARFTYYELDRAAQRVAATLQEFMIPGSRALLCFPPGLDFLVSYLGCLYAQVIAVPVLVPRNERYLGKLSAIVADSGATVALTDAKSARAMERKKVAGSLGLPWLIIDAAENPSTPWQAPDIKPSDIAFLQYTSGSTATPNGVMVAHENLAANVSMNSKIFRHHPGTRCVTWLPVYHDMGLIGCTLQPLWQGLFTVMMPPIAFVHDPVRWLRAISRYRGTFVMSPNFGYELCCRMVDSADIPGLDLSSLETTSNGAEPIRPETLEKFSRIFEPTGFRRSSFFPCYGLAESTLVASGKHLGAEAGILLDRASLELGKVVPPQHETGTQFVVSCGASTEGQSIAIVDPHTLREAPPDQVGEIWLAGDHIAKGYWGNQEKSKEVFRAALPTRSGITFLRTGDLGFLHESQIFVTGRIKDVLVIFGRNHYPQDIEVTVEANAAIRTGNSVAFQLEQEGVEGAGIVAEVGISHLRGDLMRLAEEISEAVWAEHEVNVFQIAFIKPAALPKTSSGKLRRRYTRDLLLREELNEVFRWPQQSADDSLVDGRLQAAGDPDGPGSPGTGRVPATGPMRQLLQLPDEARERFLADLVSAQVRIILGQASSSALGPDRPLNEVGLNSLKAALLRNRIAAATGLRLPRTLLFDYPTPRSLTSHLMKLLGFAASSPPHTLAAPTADGDEPIAIVAVSCRFPGGAVTPEAFWELLAEGRDVVSEFPRNRGWNSGDAGGQMPLGGVVPDADEFDPAFFGISPREAVTIDPQQRLLLEMAWETLERAGIVPASLLGTPVGVFVGIFGNEYGMATRAGALPTALRGYLSTGSLPSMASGRIAYVLGVEGPAISVDTACSSSLVALHLACQALRHGECSLALAGGVTVVATPTIFSDLGPGTAGAPDGRCKAFSAEADGVGWAEGAGMVLLERISDAKRNAHPVLALVRGSAVNQDGRSQGLTAPNGPSQERVIRQALANARLNAADIDAVEAHGTGTPLGDPIEAQALIATYGRARDQSNPLWLGSLKSNFGHTQAAAGIGGVIKMVLAMQHGALPMTLHARTPSPHIDWSPGTVRLLNEPIAWTSNGRPRRAGVSSFGISGTNAHLILEEASAARGSAGGEDALSGERITANSPTRVLPVLLSGKSDRALRAQMAQLHAYLQAEPDLELADLAYSLATTRSHFEHRAVFVTDDTKALRGELLAVMSGQPAATAVLGRPDVSGKVVFVFPGQGSQWAGMAVPLLEASEVFREKLQACDHALAPYLDWSLLDVLREHDGAPSLENVDVVQPVLFAIMVALAAVWRALGVEPDAVAGHSQGEIAAACVAGALSLDDAAKVVALRSRMLTRLAGQGAMATIELPEDELRKRLEGSDRRISIAAINGPATLLVSGPPGDIDALVQELTSEQIFTRKVHVNYASHSEQVDTIEQELRTALAGLQPRESGLTFFSGLTGAPLSTMELGADYWYSNLRQPVRFATVSEGLLADGYRFFIEVSPHPSLVLPLVQTLEQSDVPSLVVGSLRRGQGGMDCLLRSLGELHDRGLSLNWGTFFRPLRPRCIDLPTYAFQRERFWLDDSRPQAADVTSAGLETATHPLLGAVVALPDSDGVVLTGRLSLRAQPWLADHAVFGQVIVPGTVFAELLLCAGDWLGCEFLEELVLQVPLPLPRRGGIQIRVVVGIADERGCRPVRVYSRVEETPLDAAWTLHAAGTLATRSESMDDHSAYDWDVWPPRDAVAVEPDELYGRMAEAGLDYGPGFRTLRSVWRRGDEIFAEVRLDREPVQTAERFVLHPALFEAALHPLWLLREACEMPFAFADVRLHASDAAMLRVRLTATGGSASLAAVDSAGQPVLTVGSVVTRPVDEQQIREGDNDSATDVLLRVEWVAESGNGAVPAVRNEAVSDRIAVLGADPANQLGELPAGELRICPDWETLTAELDRSWIPDVVVTLCDTDADTSAEEGLVASVYSSTDRMLATIQRWLGDARLEGAQLVLVTRNAMADNGTQLVGAPPWGLARTAQSEHPGRFVLIDVDETASAVLVARAITVARTSNEPQLAIRHGDIRVPRLAPLERHQAGNDADPNTGGTVLITGGTGALGRSIARHLVFEHGADDLVLLARGITAAEDTADLVAELTGLARVTVMSCDVANRDDLTRVLAELEAEGHQLTAVVHAAGTVDGGAIQSLDHERLNTVLRPKVDGAWNLHEATRGMALSQFVLFSSAASIFGLSGQGNYAAANAFLDALARYRHVHGLPATAIAWGAWQQDAGMAGRLSEADRARMRRSGLLPISPATALRVFDIARTGDQPVVVAAPIDAATLRARAEPPALFRTLIRPARPTASNNDPGGRARLHDRLAGLPAAEQSQLLLDLVRAEVALVLGYSSADSIRADQAFSDLGLDSLTAVELRNNLTARTGLRLPAALVFNYPTPGVLADFLQAKLTGIRTAAVVDDRELAIRRALSDLPYDKLRQLGIIDILTSYREGTPGRADVPDESNIKKMNVDELIQMVDLIEGFTDMLGACRVVISPCPKKRSACHAYVAGASVNIPTVDAVGRYRYAK